MDCRASFYVYNTEDEIDVFSRPSEKRGGYDDDEFEMYQDNILDHYETRPTRAPWNIQRSRSVTSTPCVGTKCTLGAPEQRRLPGRRVFRGQRLCH